MAESEPLRLSRAVSQEAIDRYAAASGDFNPIHVDVEFARATPLGGTIAHGMLVLAYVSTAMTEAFGRRWCERGRLKVRFKAPARCGQTLAVVAAPREGPGRYAVTVTDSTGETLVTGTAEVTLE